MPSPTHASGGRTSGRSSLLSTSRPTYSPSSTSTPPKVRTFTKFSFRFHCKQFSTLVFIQRSDFFFFFWKLKRFYPDDWNELKFENTEKKKKQFWVWVWCVGVDWGVAALSVEEFGKRWEFLGVFGWDWEDPEVVSCKFHWILLLLEKFVCSMGNDLWNLKADCCN